MDAAAIGIIVATFAHLLHPVAADFDPVSALAYLLALDAADMSRTLMSARGKIRGSVYPDLAAEPLESFTPREA